MPTARGPATGTLASPTVTEVRKSVAEIGAELVRITDRALVLLSVVRRTRALVGADMAYLSLNDLTEGETFIHATDGVRTEAYRTIRMPIGTGILGTIAAGKELVYTNDYIADENMVHVPRIDTIVEGEGVRTITGSPLRLGGRVVGALLVAHRERAIVPPRARFAIEQLATQASIVIDLITRSGEVSKLRALIGETEVTTAGKLRELERLLELDEQLMGGLVRASNPRHVVEVIAKTLGRRVEFAHVDGTWVAGAHILGEGGADDSVLEGVRASSRSATPEVVRTADGTVTVMAVVVAEELFGFLLMTGAGHREAVVLRRAAIYVGAAALVERTLVDAEHRAQSSLIEDLLLPRAEDRPAGIMQRLSEYGITRNSAVVALCVHVAAGDRAKALSVVRSLFRASRAIVSPHEGHLCVILAGRDGRQVGDAAGAALADASIQARIGIAVTRGEMPDALPEVHRHAAEIVLAAEALGRSSGVYDEAALGVAGVVLSGADAGVAAAIIERFLGGMLSYDRAHGTALVDTAWHFLENGGRIKETATALRVHPNTVKQRLERIGAVQGAGWRDNVVDTHFALRLWRVRRTS